MDKDDDPFLVFGSPLILDAEIEEVTDSLRSAWLGTGPKVARFEEEFASYKSAAHAVAVNSGTAAMHLSLLAAGIGPGDEVLTTAMTFCSTVNVILHVGATPVLADVDSATFNIDPASIAARITPRTRAILPVHFGGRACDMSAIMELAERHDLVVIEDCAHAVETTYAGRPAGSFGLAGCFSFYATKNVTTGEGGMVTTADAALAAEVKSRALHGLSRDAWKRFSDEGYRHYYVQNLGFKYNMMDLQAAIGLHQLRRVEDNWLRRQEIWERYQLELAPLPLVLPPSPEDGTRHAYHLFTPLLGEDARLTRDDFLDEMTRRGIGVGVHYLSVPEHPYYQQSLDWEPRDWPVSRDIGRRTVSLPLSAKLTDADVDRVVAAVRGALGG